MGGWNEFYIKKKWFFLKKVKKNEKNWKKLKKMHQKWVAGCLCGQNMKNYEWNSCKKLWTWEGVNKFYITKLIFSKQSWKKNWKKLKKNASKVSCWVPLTWLEHAQDMPRTWQDMLRTWQDTWGLIWVFKNSKSDQNPPRYRHFCTANCRTNVSNMQSFSY
jgi:hypothetical protein